MNQINKETLEDFTQAPYTHILYNGFRHNELMDEASKETIENVGKALMPIAVEMAHWENAYVQIRTNGSFTIDDGFPLYLMTRIMELIH